jgi:hypothetical protein
MLTAASIWLSGLASDALLFAPGVKVFEGSARTGAGISEWLELLLDAILPQLRAIPSQHTSTFGFLPSASSAEEVGFEPTVPVTRNSGGNLPTGGA